MSETIKTGGVGKSPAIEKINRLNAITNRMQAAAELEKRAFEAESRKAGEELARRKKILDEFSVSFRKLSETERA